MKRTLFITGTDTDAGKTVLTALLARFLREHGVNVAALKPVGSGGRADAQALHAALGGTLALDEINPWHFRASIAPTLAARREKRRVKLAEILKQVGFIRKRFEITLVEGAGGLLSPMGEDFDSRDLLIALRATPVIVCPNRLGAVNQVRLVLAALPAKWRRQARVVLVSPARPDTASRSNAALLAEFFPKQRIWLLPWLGRGFSAAQVLKNPRVCRVLAGLAKL